VGITGDAKEVLREMIELVRERPFSHRGWLESISEQAREGRRSMLSAVPGFDREEPIHPARLMKEIRDFLEDDAIVVADGGDTQVWTILGVEIPRPGQLLSSGPFGCLGVGIPFALAAKLRYPNRQVLTTMGDGSAGLNIMEFNTALRFDLPIVMVISNDCWPTGRDVWSAASSATCRMRRSSRLSADTASVWTGPRRSDRRSRGPSPPEDPPVSTCIPTARWEHPWE
jgi:acetolactate synthase-1/2/3 large subunit